MKTQILLLFSLLALFAQAQNSERDSIGMQLIPEVKVGGDQIKHTNISRSGISEMNLPQAMSILNAQILEQQQVATLTDLLKNVSGIYIMGNTGGYQEEVASRGSSISSTNTFKNGVRFFNGMKLNLSGVESVEILKGNSAIEYGNVAPGGVLNIITKKPKFDFGGSVGFTLGSFATYKPQFDVYAALNKKKSVAFRLNGSYEQAESFRNEVKSNGLYVNPSVLFRLGAKSSILIEGDFSKSTSTPDFGAGIVNYKIVEIPRDRFVGVSWGNYTAQQSMTSARYLRNISHNWELSTITAYRNYSTELFGNSRPNSSGGLIANDGTWNRSIQKSEASDNYFVQQIDLKTNFKTGGVTHQLSFGADADYTDSETKSYKTLSNYDIINIFQPYNPALEPAKPAAMTQNTTTSAITKRVGAYAQDLISFPKYLKVLLGVRYNYLQTESDVLTHSTEAHAITTQTDRPFSPKIGLVLQPSSAHTIFASYSNSFSTNTGVDLSGKALKPSIIDQYEIGTKSKLLQERIQLNLTAYQIRNSNLAQMSLANGNTNTSVKELSGETQSTGLELDLIYRLSPELSFMAGYSFNETKYTQSNTYIVGSKLRYNPDHTANASVNYSFTQGSLKNLNLGLIAQYIGQRYAGRSTQLTTENDTRQLIPLSSYIVLDANASYTYKAFRLNLKLSNLLNELSYNIHDDNSLNPIAPTNFTAQLTYQF